MKAELTKRETQIAEMLAWGAAKKQIAGKLYISPRTVENTARSIYEKAGVHSVGQLSAWWFCKRYAISEMLNPLLAVFFIILVCVNEWKSDDTALRATRTVKTARASKTRRRHE